MPKVELVNVRTRVMRYLSAHPTCTEDEVVGAWTRAVYAAQPRNDRWRAPSGAWLLGRYRAALDPTAGRGAHTFREQRDWLVSTMTKDA